MCFSLLCLVTPPPSPILWPRNKIITLINNVTSHTITCMTVGAIIYRWHKHPHRGIPDNINVAGRLTNRLQLINLQPHYAGSYQCQVKNSSGISHSHFSTLIIKGLFTILQCNSYMCSVC